MCFFSNHCKYHLLISIFKQTCLHRAIINDHAPIVSYLVSVKVDPNVTCSSWKDLIDVVSIFLLKNNNF